MRSHSRESAKIVAVLMLVLALASFSAGCRSPVAGRAAAESETTLTPQEVAHQATGLATPSPSFSDRPASEAENAVKGATPAVAMAHVSQSDTDAHAPGTNTSAISSPLPTPTPVPLAHWIALNKNAPAGAETALEASEWARDGIDWRESGVVAALVALNADPNPPLAFTEWLAMPFLLTVEPADEAALRALRSVQLNDPKTYHVLLEHLTTKTPFTDRWAPVVAALPGPRLSTRGRYEVPASLLGELLDPDIVTVEERIISLPLAGPITVAVVRTVHGSERTMDRLVHAISAAEAFMQEPFPIRHVTMLFSDWPEGSPVVAINNHHSLTSGTVLDVGDGDPMAPISSYIIAHEIAHFYWTGHSDWLDEGAAELIARAATASEENPYRPQWACELSESLTIANLEALQLRPDQPGYSCNYVLGLQHLNYLEDRMGRPAFIRWLRSQYRNEP